MPFVHITWLPKACRTAAVRKEVADAVIKVSGEEQIRNGGITIYQHTEPLISFIMTYQLVGIVCQ